MSGPADLARLSETIDTANELFLSDQVKMIDVGGGVMRPTNAKVLADLSTQMSGSLIYTTVALGLAGTVAGGYFSVEASDSAEYLVLYRNESGVAVEKKRYPSAQAIANVSQLISTSPTSAAEVEILVIADNEGGKHASLTPRRLRTTAFELSNEGPGLMIGDAEGGVSIYVDDKRAFIGPFEILRSDAPDEDPFVSPPFFSPLLVTADGYPQRLNIKNMLYRRELANSVVGSISSTTTSAVETGPVLTVNPGQYGSAAVLNLRQQNAPDARRLMTISVKNVAKQVVVNSPKILIIGDSISNRQGGFFLKQILEGLGFTPVFIGTINGSAVPDNSNNSAGVLGEAREGWETGDFTYAVTDRALVIPPGGESDYNEMTKTDKWPRNPFLRPATGADSASIIRNGYVFDPAFYQSRFGLQTPDIVINLLGTNDARDRTDATVYSSVLDNDTLMHNQIRSAWPSAKIIRSLPGTAYNAERNLVWTTRYAPMIQAMQQAAVNRADSKSILVPLWALTNPEAGYVYSPGTVGLDGFSVADWADSIHPAQATRLALFEALAPYVAAAATNLI